MTTTATAAATPTAAATTTATTLIDDKDQFAYISIQPIGLSVNRVALKARARLWTANSKTALIKVNSKNVTVVSWHSTYKPMGEVRARLTINDLVWVKYVERSGRIHEMPRQLTYPLPYSDQRI